MDAGMDDAAGQPVIDAARMVDLARYPIADPDSAAGAAFRQACRERFLEDGLCMLPGFISPEALETLAREAEGFAGDAWFCRSTHNVYLTDHDPDAPRDDRLSPSGGGPHNVCPTGHDPATPAGDVAGRQERTFVGSVPYDRIGEASSLRRLYLWDPLKDFVGAVLGKERLHRFADPLGACSVNVFVDGGEHGWHFDESEFTVTLMLQPPESGGAFEYVPRIRGREDEQAIVGAVLNGGRAGVVELPFTAGALLVFGGRQTLHRVTRVHGARPRLVPVLCYAERPGLRNSEAVRKLFWGRTGTEDDPGNRRAKA